MLSKEEYDPITCRLGLPHISNFYGRKFRVRVTNKDDYLTFITHIKRPRDNNWELIEGKYDGNLNVKKNLKLFLLEFERKLRPIERGGYREIVEYLSDLNMPFINKDGTFTGQFDDQKYELLSDYNQRLSKTYFEKIIKFIKSRELSDLGY